MKPKFISIRKKLQLVVAAATLAAVLILLIGNIVGDVWAYHRDLTEELSAQAEAMAGNATAALAHAEPAIVAREFRELKSSVRVAAVYNVHGQLFAFHAQPGSSAAAPAAPGPSGTHIAGHDMVLVQPLRVDGVVVGHTYLAAEYDLRKIITEDIEIALLVAVLALAIALLLIRRLERLVTAPVIAAAGMVRSVAEQGDYTRRVQRGSNDEVGILVDSFNDMLALVQRRTALLEASNGKLAGEVRQRESAQQEVMALNAALEARVHERTVQLGEANRALVLAKQAADQARATAEEANTAKSAFLSSMSHELRTPLNAILGFAQLLASDVHAEEHRQEFAGYILKGGHHLLTMIDEILDLAKVESGALMLVLEPVALAGVLHDCQALIAPLADRRQIALAFPQQPAQVVLADRTRLKQILLNLLSNAIKYNRADGSVLVDCRPASGGRVRIGVRDSGPGLSAAQQQGLFQPFNRLGQEHGGEEGTGIGLVVSKRLVELMGGTIGVRSTVGTGSEFWIELVASADADPHAAGPAEAPRPAVQVFDGAAPTLLYVEDNPVNLKLVEALVALHPDVRLLSAPHAHLGIELARVHLPDAILMDIDLPGMNGIEALEVLRADPATMHIPVIAVTAGVMPGDAVPGAAGFFRTLAKPIDVDEFWRIIGAALSTRKTGGTP